MFRYVITEFTKLLLKFISFSLEGLATWPGINLRRSHGIPAINKCHIVYIRATVQSLWYIYLWTNWVLPVFYCMGVACPYHCLEGRRVNVGGRDVYLCPQSLPRSILQNKHDTTATTKRCLLYTYPQQPI